jgi:hypothetical protein
MTYKNRTKQNMLRSLSNDPLDKLSVNRDLVVVVTAREGSLYASNEMTNWLITDGLLHNRRRFNIYMQGTEGWCVETP